MGTILASKIFADARFVLQDAAGLRWGDPELLSHLNAGQREVLIYKPTAFVVNMSVKLGAGTKQSLPVDGVQFVDMPRNMGVDGITPGRAIRLAERETLDAVQPEWHAANPQSVVKHFIYNPLDPLRVYVYPPQPTAGQGYVEMVYGAQPPDVAGANAPISLHDIYATVLTDFVIYRALLKDSEYADPSRAAAHRTAFINALAGKASIEAALEPNRSGQPATKPAQG